MKLTEEQKAHIKNIWGDWEEVHCYYDKLLENRLRELDEEFVVELEEITKDATFWYA